MGHVGQPAFTGSFVLGDYMTAREEESPPTEPGTGDQFLDALDELARVELALCVEQLMIYCALGRGLSPADPPPDPDAAATLATVNAAAEMMFGMALAQMTHLQRVNDVLTLAGRPPQVGRAAVFTGHSGPAVTFGPLSDDQLAGFLDREGAIGALLEAHYAWLQSALAPLADSLTGDLLDRITFLFDTCSDHTSRVDGVRARLAGIPPALFLRATRRIPADDLERSVLLLSDQYYALVVDTMQASFAFDHELGGQLRNRGITIMDVLNEVNGLLVERGLLPSFTPATDRSDASSATGAA